MLDPLVPCEACHKDTHDAYWTNRWQITQTTVGVNPDGSSITSTPFAAVACSPECAMKVLDRRCAPTGALATQEDPDVAG